LLPSCSTPTHALNLTVERYLSAVQQRSDETMARLWAPYRREVDGVSLEAEKKAFDAFQAVIRRAHQDFETAKRTREITPDPLGVGLFRALGLGKGTVSIPLGTEIEEGGQSARVRTRIVTNLENLHLETLPDGVRIYLVGYPLGRLEMIAVGYDDLSKHSLLGSVDIDWRLSRASGDIRTLTGWLIESIAPDPESAVQWKPSRRQR
jgi:hypothetical protein